MHTTRAIGATATLLAVLAASGCGGSSGGSSSTSAPSATHTSKSGIASGEPTPAKTSKSSKASPASSAKPTSSSKGTAAGAPGVPEAARQHTKAGAKAFGEYFYSRVNTYYRKPTEDVISRLYSKSCSVCGDFERDAAGMRKKHQHFIDDQVKYRTTRLSEVPGGFNVFITISQNPARWVDSAGNVVGTTPTPVTKSVVLLDWIDQKGWTVHEIQYE